MEQDERIDITAHRILRERGWFTCSEYDKYVIYGSLCSLYGQIAQGTALTSINLDAMKPLNRAIEYCQEYLSQFERSGTITMPQGV